MSDLTPRKWHQRPEVRIGAGLVLAIVAVILMRGRLVHGYAYEEKLPEAAAETAMALLAVSLFLERAMTLVNAIIFGDAQREAEINQMNLNTEDTQRQLASVLGSKERLRLLGSFVAALFLSAAGVRTLEGILVTPAPGAAVNPLLFPVDVLLTASLLAGGSNGLAFLVQLIKNRLAPPAEQDPVPGAQPGRTGTGETTSGTTRSGPRPGTAFWTRMTSTG